MSWAKQEFETIELGDARLNQRAVLLAERLGQKPEQSHLHVIKPSIYARNWSEAETISRAPRKTPIRPPLVKLQRFESAPSRSR